MDEFKRHIKGFRKGGTTCPCCREAEKQKSRRLARRRLGKLLLEVWRNEQAPD